jgi:ADP-ribose pyrophosphatase
MSEESRWRLVRADILAQDDWVTVERKTFEVQGSTELSSFLSIRRPDFVLIVAFDNEMRVAVVRQFRPGTEQWYWALPAGYVNVGEEPVAAALRELAEETGFRALSAEVVGELHPLPGYVRSTATVVLCSNLEATGETLDQEIDQVEWLSFRTAVDRVVSGDINEMQAVAALLIVREIIDRRERAGARS